MSLLDTASLIITPNGYKEGTLYSVIPNTTLGDMTVVRATTATRVNSAGLIEVIPWNLADNSNSFGNLVGITNTTGQQGPFTATSGNLLTPIGSGEHYSNTLALTVVVGNTYTYSAYAKFVQGVQFVLRTVFSNGDEDISTIWDLSTGVLVANAANHTTPTITNVGNGWYRCSITYTPSIVPSFPLLFRIQMAVGGSLFFTASSGQGFLAYGAQINNGALATYFPTTNRLNVPRLDYSNGSCPSLLVEPQRTNLVLYSEQFDNADWNNYALNVTVTANTTISPDGTQNADTVAFGAFGFLYQSFAIIGLASATFSIYAKTATQIIVFGGATPLGTDIYTTINVGNGWFRQILTRTFTGGGTGTLQILPFGNNVTAFLWGCQVEAGSYPTSYIPTTSAAVTRNADAISKTGISSLIGQTQGTIFADAYLTGTDTSNGSILIATDKASSGAIIRIIYANGVALRFDVYDGSSFQCLISAGAYNVGDRVKVAGAYKNNDFVMYVNGTQIGTDVSGTVPATNKANINTSIYGDTNGSRINSAILFPTRLTNAELASLTTI
jgi:hypothetical protein